MGRIFSKSKEKDGTLMTQPNKKTPVSGLCPDLLNQKKIIQKKEDKRCLKTIVKKGNYREKITQEILFQQGETNYSSFLINILNLYENEYKEAETVCSDI